MRTAQFIYRSEPDGWWAASPDLPGYSAIGDSFEEVRRLAAEGAPWFAGHEMELHHLVLGEGRGWTSATSGRGQAGTLLDLVLPSRPSGFSISPSGLQAA
jgi:predicted RNase H-like HicB family nuclease